MVGHSESIAEFVRNCLKIHILKSPITSAFQEVVRLSDLTHAGGLLLSTLRHSWVLSVGTRVVQRPTERKLVRGVRYGSGFVRRICGEIKWRSIA
jgi:hypothetical protein